MEKYFKKEYLLLLLFITFLPTIIYFLNFVCSDIKNTPETWAQFGDFIGGTTGIIIGVFNIIATIILALVINNYDNNRNKDALELQQNLFERELKEVAYKEFQKIIKRPNVTPYDTEEYIKYLEVLNFQIIDFFYYNSHIFKSITTKNLIDRTFSILEQTINDLQQFDKHRGKYYKGRKLMPEIFKERNKLFEEINTYFIDEIKKPL